MFLKFLLMEREMLSLAAIVEELKKWDELYFLLSNNW